MSSLSQWLVKSLSCTFQKYVNFQVFHLIFVSNFILLWSGNILCICIFLDTLRIRFWPNIWSVLENISRRFEKNVYTVFVRKGSLYMSVRSGWFILLFKSSVFLLIL